MGAIRPPEGIAGRGVEFGIDGGQIAFGEENVAVQDEQIVALGAFRTVVARLSRSAVGFGIVVDAKAVGIAGHDGIAGDTAAVFDDDHFEVGETLARQRIEQLIALVGTVIYGDYDGKSHICEAFRTRGCEEVFAFWLCEGKYT